LCKGLKLELQITKSNMEQFIVPELERELCTIETNNSIIIQSLRVIIKT